MPISFILFVCAQKPVRMRIYTHDHAYVSVYMCVHMYVRTYVRVYAHVSVSVCFTRVMRLHGCVCVSVYLCACICAHITAEN